MTTSPDLHWTPDQLWGSKAESVVLECLRRAKWTAECNRRECAALRRDLLEDDWKPELKAFLHKIYKSRLVRETIDPLTTIEHNVFKRINTELSTVYDQPAIREVRGNPRQNQLAAMMWREAKIDAVLAHANLLLNAQRDLILFPMVSPSGKMKIHIATPDNLSVIQHPEDPTEVVAAFWDRHLSNTVPSNAAYAFGYNEGARQTVYADAVFWRVYDGNGKIVFQREHGHGCFPGVVLHAGHRTDSFFCPAPGEDMVDATMFVAAGLTRLERMMHIHSELLLTFSGNIKELSDGILAAGEQVLASEKPESQGGGSWSVLDFQGDPSRLLSVITARIGWIAQQHGLAADVYDLSAAATSGFQIRLKRLPLIEQRRKQKPTWVDAEHELFTRMAMVSLTDHPILKIDPLGDFSVNHADEPFMEDPEVEIDIFDGWVRQNRITRPEVLRRDDPDLTEEQAREKFKRNQDENLEAAAVQASRQTSGDPLVDEAHAPGRPPTRSRDDNTARGVDSRREARRGAKPVDEDLDKMAAAALKKMRSAG